MFYTLTSKIPLIPSGKNHFLIVFVLGSLAYIALNYYLYSGQAPEFVNKLKTYVYYLMAVDLAIAYFLSKGTNNCESEEEEKGGYTPEQKEQIEQDLQMLRKSNKSKIDAYTQRAQQMEEEQLVQEQLARTQHQKNKHKELSEEESVAKSNQSPFKTIDEVEEDDKREKEAKSSPKSSNKSETESVEEEITDERPVKKNVKKTIKQTKKSKQNTDEDTDIPVYGV
jgi:hypothetical protein